jgi:pimeloyl-ACP methyl ester carboxylesterase
MAEHIPASSSPEPDTHRIDVGGARLHVLDWGGEGMPVVFLPGLGQSAHIFRMLVPGIGDGFRCVAITPRAQGESDAPETGYTLDGFAADVRGVMDALGIRGAALAAHSIGGAVATHLAAECPSRVSALVYLDSVTDYRGIGHIQHRNPARPPPLPTGAGDAMERAWCRVCLYGRWDDAVEADWRARPAPGERARRQDLLAELVDDAVHSREPFAATRCPALAIMAEESVDTLFPWLPADDSRREAAERFLRETRGPWRRLSAERFLRESPYGSLTHIPGNHFFFLSAPARTAAEIRGFLLSTRSGPDR